MARYNQARLLREIGDLPLTDDQVASVSIDLFDTIDSTNDYLKRSPRPDSYYHLCLAETQTHGRGSNARRWHSPDCENIYLSIKLPTTLSWQDLSGLSLVVGLSIAKTLSTFDLSSTPKVKWPNDVYIKDQKIAGVLIDILSTDQIPSDLIIGIGINVNMQHAEGDFTTPWISLCEVCNALPQRETLIGQLMKTLHASLMQFKTHGFPFFLSEWASYDYLVQKKIEIQTPPPKKEALVIGVDASGRLLIEDGYGMSAMNTLTFKIC